MKNLTSIAIFVAVAEMGSFTSAAEKLGIVRSVASRRVTLLEKELKTRLLHRTTRCVSLTAAGQHFYEQASEGLRTIWNAQKELHASSEELNGKLVASVPMSFGLMHVVPAMAEFRLLYPKLRIELKFDDEQADLVKDSIDVALRIAHLEDSSLVARQLAKIRHVVVASPSYLARYGTPSSPLELSKRDCIVYTLKSPPRFWRFQHNEDFEEVHVDGNYCTNNSLAIREMLLAGMGIALVPIFLVAHDLQRGQLSQVLGEWKTEALELSVVYPSRRHVPPAVRMFISFMEKRIGQPPYWDGSEQKS